ncbi:MAG: hypothetical protein E6R03_03190 [Hyphomicrobiaceae bacterium]|nr:MAG: hypothetical protein E6R03_03190 [Hyphomicrobiaceae bacterium]
MNLMGWIKLAAIAALFVLGCTFAWFVINDDAAPNILVAAAVVAGIVGVAAGIFLLLFGWVIVEEYVRIT